MKTFIDTSPFIYLVENHPLFAAKVRSFILDALSNENSLITSVITLMEFGVLPEKKGRSEIIINFESLLEIAGISMIEIDQKIAENAYKLRAKYGFLKGMDAIQIAVALEKKCDQFLTNDKKLSSVSEINILLVEEL